MVSQELTVRLNDVEYTNWLKAGRCLLILKEALHPFVKARMGAFHRYLLDVNTLLRKPCRTSCKPRNNKLSGACRVCSEWQAEIMKHHRQPVATVNWGNCFPPSWRTDHWEVAKAFMPRGQLNVKVAYACDASALLNLINYCDYFSSVEPRYVGEVIRYRNELMHSCEFRVKDEWMRNYHRTLIDFMRQLSQVPQMATAKKQMNQMLTVDLSICVSGLDRMDSAAVDGLQHDSVNQQEPSVIGQWEAELLQERLQELLHASPAEDDTMPDMERLTRMAGFLQANRDLGERFSAELQAINSLKAGKQMNDDDELSALQF